MAELVSARFWELGVLSAVVFRIFGSTPLPFTAGVVGAGEASVLGTGEGKVAPDVDTDGSGEVGTCALLPAGVVGCHMSTT